MSDKCVALVDNLLDVQCATPVELIPQHILRKPSFEELPKFREALERWGGLLPQTLRFESIITGHEDHWTARQTSNPADWRYWVIAANPAGVVNDGIHQLMELTRLTEVELQFRFYSVNVEGVLAGVGFIGTEAAATDRVSSIPQPFTDLLVETIRRLHLQAERAKQSYPEVYRAVSMYEHLANTPRNTHLYILGVFAVLEAILTHDPKGEYDSLGHQIKTKMKLLNSRFEVPLNCEPFENCAFDKLWSKLYQLRSMIAHGKQPDFQADLRVLRDFGTARRFLDGAAKSLLRQALAEPQLVHDLQYC